MDEDAILSFTAPDREPGRVDVTPSPVLELAYAAFTITKRGVPPAPGGATPPWLRRLSIESPQPLLAVAAFWTSRGVSGPDAETFLLATRYGYARDPDPERFLRDFPELVERYLAEGSSSDTGARREALDRILPRLTLLRREAASEWVAVHRALWSVLAQVWELERRPAVEAAVATFLDRYGESGSVLDSLPRHHFTQFEAATAAIRRAESEGRLLVIPLGLAVTGGFRFDVDGTLYVGFGIQAERVHERTAARVAELAARMKAFADPTRAMLLALISRFEGMQLTVGDLAAQLGVSQPTVSGHLRLLRQAGLVLVERRGNKTHHRLDQQALHGLLTDFETAVVSGAEAENGSSA